jgi:hypothetical protein
LHGLNGFEGSKKGGGSSPRNEKVAGAPVGRVNLVAPVVGIPRNVLAPARSTTEGAPRLVRGPRFFRR